jgi:cytochrome P450
MQMMMAARDSDTGEGMSDTQLRDEITSLLIAGHETTAQALAWAVYELAVNEGICQQVRSEIDETASGSSPAHLAASDLMDKVIREALRKYPPVWAITRKALNDTVVCGYKIPAGSSLLLNIYGVHRSARHWQKPDEFYPVHFDEKTTAYRHPFSFVPFGAGPRMCIGNHLSMMIMQATITGLVKNFHFRLPPGYKAVEEAAVTLKPKGDVVGELTLLKGKHCLQSPIRPDQRQACPDQTGQQ